MKVRRIDVGTYEVEHNERLRFKLVNTGGWYFHGLNDQSHDFLKQHLCDGRLVTMKGGLARLERELGFLQVSRTHEALLHYKWANTSDEVWKHPSGAVVKVNHEGTIKVEVSFDGDPGDYLMNVEPITRSIRDLYLRCH